ncbi:MAG: hypothetical protein AB7E72_17215 [Lysobacterales bacterium]
MRSKLLLHRLRMTLALLFLCALGSPAVGQVIAPAQVLDPPTPPPEERFHGNSVSSDGQYLAVGAPYYNGGTGGTSPGSVIIYRKLAGSWTFSQRLQAPTPVNGDGFGFHVELVGTQLIVGAPFSTVGGVNQRGAVYFYQRAGTSFGTNPQVLEPGTAPGANAGFGFHHSQDGGWLAIGAIRGGGGDGQVQLYRFDGDFEVWIYHSTLDVSLSSGSNFGVRTLMRGDRLLVTANAEQSTLGWAYEFERAGNGATAVWSQRQRFRPTSQSGAGTSSSFGSALALTDDGLSLLVGAPNERPVNGGAIIGAVFAFERNSAGNWQQIQRFSNTSPALTSSSFGSALAIDGSYALVADIRAGMGTPKPGAVQRYARGTAGLWSAPTSTYFFGASSTDSFFGAAISWRDGEAIIAAPLAPTGGSTSLGSGRVFTYLLGNTAPVINISTSLQRRQGAAPSAGTGVAEVADNESAPQSLEGTAIAGGTATGITTVVTDNIGGGLIAEVNAGCTATTGTQRLQVSDGLLAATGNLQVNVLPNDQPVLAYAPAGVPLSGAGSINPSQGPSDLGSISSVVVQSSGSYTGSLSVDGGGVIAYANAAPIGTHTVTIRATDNCGATGDASFALTVSNSAPSMAPAAPISRQQGSAPGPAVTLGTLSDPDTQLTALTVSQVSGGSASGISISQLTNTAGTVTAVLSAGCTATSGTLRFVVSDGSNTGTADVQINVASNSAPVLGNYASSAMLLGQSISVTPDAPPSDNGSVSSISVSSNPNTFAGSLSASTSTGVVSIGSAGPVGAYTIALTAVDNCSLTSTRSFSLLVNGDAVFAHGFE